MSGRATAEREAALWYVVAEGAGALPPWPKDRDRFLFLALLRRRLRERGAACEGYCLTDREARLLIRADGDSLRAAAGAAARDYARYWHEWYAPRRKVFRPLRAAGVPGELRWDALAHLETAPVRAGLCARAENCRWSSAAAHAGWGPAYLPLEMERWRAEWTCAGWRERLEAWERDLRRVKAIVRLLERARPLRVLCGLAEEAAPPLLAMAAGSARAAAARA